MSHIRTAPREAGSRAGLGVWIALALSLLVVLITYNLPQRQSAAKNLPFAVVAPDPVTQKVAQVAIGRSAPGTFAFQRVDGVSGLKEALRHRELAGGIAVVPTGSGTVYVSSAASPAIAKGLHRLSDEMGTKLGITVPVVDVVPLPAADPKGRGARDGALWTMALATVISLLASRRIGGQAIRRITVALAGGALSGALVATALMLSGSTTKMVLGPLVLVGLVAAALITGAGLLLGRIGEMVTIVLLLAIGVPLSANTSLPSLIPWGLGGLGQAMPAGAATTWLRNSAYFPQVPVGQNISVLLGWLAAGLLLCAVGVLRAQRAHST